MSAALRDLFNQADESGDSNAYKFARHAMMRATDGGKNEHAWAKLVMEYLEGPPKHEVELSMGMPALLKDAHERWLRTRDETSGIYPTKSDATEELRDEHATEELHGDNDESSLIRDEPPTNGVGETPGATGELRG